METPTDAGIDIAPVPGTSARCCFGRRRPVCLDGCDRSARVGGRCAGAEKSGARGRRDEGQHVAGIAGRITGPLVVVARGRASRLCRSRVRGLVGAGPRCRDREPIRVRMEFAHRRGGGPRHGRGLQPDQGSHVAVQRARVLCARDRIDRRDSAEAGRARPHLRGAGERGGRAVAGGLPLERGRDRHRPLRAAGRGQHGHRVHAARPGHAGPHGAPCRVRGPGRRFFTPRRAGAGRARTHRAAVPHRRRADL